MVAAVRAHWRAVRDNPVLQLELQRIHRRKWWPGKLFHVFCLLFCPALVGVALVYIALLFLTDVPFEAPWWVTLILGVLVVLLPGAFVALLSFALPWIAPALTAASIAREREMGTLEVLRTTLLPERTIVLGKLSVFLVQMWPGILLLILLAPFQIVRLSLGSFGLCLSPDWMLYTGFFELGAGGQAWGLLLLLPALMSRTLSCVLETLADLVLHAAVGLFVSTLCRSSGAAVAISYGAVLVIRIGMWLLVTFLSIMLSVLMVFPMLLAAGSLALAGGVGVFAAFAPSLISLAVVFIEILAAAFLVWGAIWGLRRV